MTKGNNLYNTQYLKSWSQNANKELYLTDQSILENDYSLNEDIVYSQEDLNTLRRAEGSWIDLDPYKILSSNNESDSSSEKLVFDAFNTESGFANNNRVNDDDGSLTTILWDMADQHRQQYERRSSNTTATSVTVVGALNKVSTKRHHDYHYSGDTIPEMPSSSSSLGSSVDNDLKFQRSKRRKEKPIVSKGRKDINLSNILFQITCLSVIIASFSFSLGFLFGSRNKSSSLKYFQ